MSQSPDKVGLIRTIARADDIKILEGFACELVCLFVRKKDQNPGIQVLGSVYTSRNLSQRRKTKEF